MRRLRCATRVTLRPVLTPCRAKRALGVSPVSAQRAGEARRSDEDRDDDGREAAAGPSGRGMIFGKVTVGDEWAAKEQGGGRQGVDGADYLYELGRSQQFNVDVTVGARAGMVDSKFVGGFLGKASDIASGELQNNETRTFANLIGDYYVPPAFLDAFALFVVKNFLAESLGSRIPLILGIWGEKGCGKSFQIELACRRMGIVPIVTSAGELEDEWAGEPGQLLRQRYRRAAQVIKNEGKMSCLVINDLDAGCGRFANTQCTVNNQMVMGTLMNLCDNPERVSVGQDWREDDLICRVPIIITANDLSTLYAPLLRDGRMEKFYWKPSEEDITQMVLQMYKDDGLTIDQVRTLVSEFEDQPLDFFGALRARAYDEQIWEWTRRTAREAAEALGAGKDYKSGQTEVDAYNLKAVTERLMRLRKEQDTLTERGVDVPDLELESVSVDLEKLLEEGRDLVREQQAVLDNQLSREYLAWQRDPEEVAAEEAAKRPVPPPPSQQQIAEAVEAAKRSQGERNAMLEQAQSIRRAVEAEERARREAELAAMPPPEPEPEPEPERWHSARPPLAHAMQHGSTASEFWLDTWDEDDLYTLVDVRSVRSHGREAPRGAVSVPAVSLSGPPLALVAEPLEGFAEAFAERFPDKAARVLVLGGEDGEAAEGAMEILVEQLGYTNAVEVAGGYLAWTDCYSPAGRARPPQGKFKYETGAPGTVCVGAELTGDFGYGDKSNG